VTQGVTCLNLCYTLSTLARTGRRCRRPNLCYLLIMRGTGIGCCFFNSCCCCTTNAVDWVVWRSNHHAVLSLATTSPDLPVPAPRHGSPPAVPRLAPPGTASYMVSRPKVPVYCHGGCWPFVYIMPQDIAVYRHAGHSSLTLWGTFWATQSVSGWDIFIAAALASFAHKLHKLIHDVSHHGQTSAGRVHHCSVLS
jgi:hypothetical protein